MPERRYKRGCGPSCIRCWVNNLKHGNEEAKAFLKEHPELGWDVKHGDTLESLDKTEDTTDTKETADEDTLNQDEKAKENKSKKREARQKELENRRKIREIMRCLPEDQRQTFMTGVDSD